MYDCEKVSELLTSFVSGELHSDEETAVSEHVRDCGPCCGEAEKYTLALEKGKAAFGDTIELSPEELTELKYQVMSAVTAEDRRKAESAEAKGVPARRFKLFKYASIAASVLAAAALAIGWAYLAKIDRETPKTPSNPHLHDKPLKSSERDFNDHLKEILKPDKARGYVGDFKTPVESKLYPVRMVRSFSVVVDGRDTPVRYCWYGGPKVLREYVSKKQREIELDFIRKYREGGPLDEAQTADDSTRLEE